MTNGWKRLFLILVLASLYFSLTRTVEASFIDRIVNIFTRVSKGPVQFSFRFFTPHDTLDPWDPWPPGPALDLPENNYINPMSFPPLPGQMFRLRIGVKILDTNLPASSRRFKLQFGKLNVGQSDCATITTWNDLGNPGSSADWRAFDMPMSALTDGALITVNKLNDATRRGGYHEQKLTALNPALSENEIIEYDWSIQHNITNSSLDGGFYCFRLANENGWALSQYVQYPKVALTKPYVNTTSSTIDRSLGGTLNMSNANNTSILLTIPASYLPTSHSFNINNFNVNDFLDQVGGVPSGKLGAHNYVYQMGAQYNNVSSTSFNQSLSFRISYSDTEISGIDENTLKIYKHDGNSWNALTTTVNQSSNTAEASINSFSSFGLFGDPTPTPTSSGGGGGGGGGLVQTTPPASINIKGKSYPNSTINFLRDAQLISKVKADKNGDFEISESGLSGGSYNFSLWALDELNLRSNTYTFFLNVVANSTNNVLGVLMPPTITLNKTTVNPGEKLRVYGSSVPDSFIIIEVRSEAMILSTKASNKGLYSQEFSTSKLAKGNHTVKSKSKISAGDESIFSSLLSFGIGSQSKKPLLAT